MTPAVIALLVCAAGGIGAAARLVLDGLIRSRIRSTYPVATTTINVTGSLLLGLLTGLAASRLLPEPWLIIAALACSAATPPSAPPASKPSHCSKTAATSPPSSTGSAPSSSARPPPPAACSSG